MPEWLEARVLNVKTGHFVEVVPRHCSKRKARYVVLIAVMSCVLAAASQNPVLIASVFAGSLIGGVHFLLFWWPVSRRTFLDIKEDTPSIGEVVMLYDSDDPQIRIKHSVGPEPVSSMHQEVG